MGSVEPIIDALETPSIDNRTYRYVRLTNALEALLVHDPTTPEAGASMDVEVGSMSDEIPGMGHAVEHLVLRGTEKYPEEREFADYFTSHSGWHNATTSSMNTNYYFQVVALPSNGEDPSADNPSPLLGALDRLAHLAIDPLFPTETIAREIQAVDSEYKMRLQDDARRNWQMDRSIFNPKRPWNNFVVGNLETLKEEPESRGIVLRDSFIDFYRNHYSANRIKLCVIGREPIQVLESWVFGSFSAIPNKNLIPNRWLGEATIAQDCIGLQCFIKPVMTYRRICLDFPFLDETYLYGSQPSQYIEYLLDQKGPGSFMAYIKNQGWATGIYSYVHSLCPESPGYFDCSITLTPEGFQNYKHVVKAFFAYIALLKETGPQKRVFEQAKSIDQLNFRFKEKTDIEDFTNTISRRMCSPIPRKWLLGPECLRNYDPELIAEALNCLRPDNVYMKIISPEGTWNQKESELLKSVNNSKDERPPELHLPRENPFIPSNLEVKQAKVSLSENNILPKLIHDDEKARTWWLGDTFGAPKAYVAVLLRSPLLHGSSENIAKANLFVRLIHDHLVNDTYEAEKAGLRYDVIYHHLGLTIFIDGYNDKLAGLLTLVLDTLRNLEIREDRFKIVKNAATDSYRNANLENPYIQAIRRLWWLTSESSAPYKEQAVKLLDIDPEGVQNFRHEFFSRLHIETYVHGNLGPDDALKLTTMVEESISPGILSPTNRPVESSLMLSPGCSYHYEEDVPDPEDVNSSIVYWISVGDAADPTVRAKTKLLGKFVYDVAFDWLRTKLQLGYIVWAGEWKLDTIYGFGVFIQGEYSCHRMERCITAFLKTYRKWLAKMDEDDFNIRKRSLITRTTEKPENLYEAYNKVWKQIRNGYYNFEENQEDAENIEVLAKEDLVLFYERYIDPSSANCAKLVVSLKTQTLKANEKPEKPLLAGSGIGVNIEDIKEDLRKTLKVKEIELEEAVELWNEINSKADERDAADINRDIQIDSIHALKSKLAKVEPKSKLQQIETLSQGW